MQAIELILFLSLSLFSPFNSSVCFVSVRILMRTQRIIWRGVLDNVKAEARLAQRRQARAEAREIRMRELERQQKEQEQNADRAFDMQTSASIDPIARTRLAMSSTTIGSLRSGTMSSRRSSEDSLEEEGRSLRDIRHELRVSCCTTDCSSRSQFALNFVCIFFVYFVAGCRGTFPKSDDCQCSIRQ